MEQNGKKVARFARKGGVQRGRATALNLLASEERTVSIFTLFLFFWIIARKNTLAVCNTCVGARVYVVLVKRECKGPCGGCGYGEG